MIDPGALALQIPSLTITTALLPDGVDAYYYPEIDTVVLDQRLTEAGKRCALMHELVHRQLADDLPTGFDRWQEKRCRDITARALINIVDLGDAVMWSVEVEEQAEHLHVNTDTLLDRLRYLTPDEEGYLRALRARADGAA